MAGRTDTGPGDSHASKSLYRLNLAGSNLFDGCLI